MRTFFFMDDYYEVIFTTGCNDAITIEQNIKNNTSVDDDGNVVSDTYGDEDSVMVNHVIFVDLEKNYCRKFTLKGKVTRSIEIT